MSIKRDLQPEKLSLLKRFNCSHINDVINELRAPLNYTLSGWIMLLSGH